MRWEKKPLTDFVLFQRGFDLPREKFIDGEFPVVGSTSILGYHKEAKVKAPGIVTGRSGTIGQFQFLKQDFWPHNTSLWVKDFKGNNEKFAYYLLHTLDFISLNGGGAVPTLNRNFLSSINVNVPKLYIQQKIASILSAYDNLIENNLKRIKLLEEKVNLVYKILIKNSQSTLKKKPIRELGNVTSSKRIFLSEYVEDGIPFYRSKEIISKATFENISNPLFILEAKYYNIKTKFGVPKSGDILITSVGTIGFIHLVNDNDGDFYFKDGNLIWIRNLSDSQLQYYLYFKFRTQEFRNMLNSIAIGSSQKALTIETVKKIEIEIPEERNLIDFNISAKIVLNLIYNLQNQNTKLREARDILLPRLISGEIGV